MELDTDYVAALNSAVEALTAYTSGLVPNFDDMSTEAWIQWTDLTLLGMFEIASNLLGWVAELRGCTVETVRAELAELIADKEFGGGDLG